MIGHGAAYIPGDVEGTKRVVVRDVQPQIDSGDYPVKRVVGDVVTVTAAVFADSHDAVSCQVLYRHEQDKAWTSLRLSPEGNDIWKGEFVVSRMGPYTFTVQGWIDRFETWHRDIKKRVDAGVELRLPLLTGALIIRDAVSRAHGADAEVLSAYERELRGMAEAESTGYDCPDPVIALMEQYPDLRSATVYDRTLEISVDRLRARYSTWYEMFPRSSPDSSGRYGTFRDCERRIPLIAGLGFDVLYLPPIHPIGNAFRKGRNNNTVASSEDVGSPWAIGADIGGHKAIDPQLGSIVDFLSLLEVAKSHGMEIALDIAFQCSPDHPYVRDHPEWFLKRPDGTIQYAENPPKKYQDIYPLNFESAAWWELWNELKSVFAYWSEVGVRIFRVDNPHTKAFPFWKWVIAEIKSTYPDVLFLAEAFTRPRPMYELAKLGFSQSYTYFTWRNSKEELSTYLGELTTEPVIEFFRPNFWPNTPDILPFDLQYADPPLFAVRFILASTLSANYGIYGPSFELCENVPKEKGSEEYLNSEKYELRQWNDDPEAGLRPLIRSVNSLRANNPALQSNGILHFHPTDNASLIAYSKTSPDRSNVVLIVVNLDPGNAQSGIVSLDRSRLQVGTDDAILLQDLTSERETKVAGSDYPVIFHPDMSVASFYKVGTQAATRL